ncbi:MAG: hypothetical protein ABUL58_00690 [Steroidobacter sp.]
MIHQKIFRPVLPASFLIVVMGVLAMLGACSTGPAVRSWVDERTAVSVTAQKRSWVFYRDDFQAGVNIYDFADLGAVEINQAGKRHQYLCLLVWSTITRPILTQAKVEENFSALTVWADDQPLTFKRITENHEMLQLGDVPFKRSAVSAGESYYEVSLSQLQTMAGAKTLRIAPANLPPREAPYNTWRDEHASLAAFVNEVANTAKLINQ